MNIETLLAKQAEGRPQHVALIDRGGDRRMTFAQVREQAWRVAIGLRDRGLRKSDRVAVLAENCIEHMVMFFACARAGFIIQSLNWRLSAVELALILEDSAPAAIVYQDRFAGMAEQIRTRLDRPVQWIDFGDGDTGGYAALVETAAIETAAPFAPVDGSDPLYILYTGGTTGESKGVLHSHSSTIHSIINNTVGERITANDVYMLTGQMFHSAVVLSLGYIVHGCTTILMNFEPRLAMELISREKVTTFMGITTMINWMMVVEDFDRYDTSSLRHIMYGGGPLPSSVVREAMAKFGCDFVGVFGQTEGNTMAFLNYEDHVAALAGDRPERLNSCGRAAFLSEIRIVDEAGALVPPGSGVAGEICVKSAANMIGYWNKPDLTAATLQDGWMRTGDLARWDEERYIFIVDRAKDMIISGGENIYSCQVEDAIHKHPAVLEAAVIGIPHLSWGETVTAYVVLRPGASATAAEIAATAADNLASYQKPREVVFIDQLPKSPSGKILKRDLRANHLSRPA